MNNMNFAHHYLMFDTLDYAPQEKIIRESLIIQPTYWLQGSL